MEDTVDGAGTVLAGGDLRGQTVVLVGERSPDSAEIERRVRAAGADVLDRARDGRLPAGGEDPADVDRVLDGSPGPLDHVLVTGAGPYHAPLADFDISRAQRDVDEHLWMPIRVARAAVGRVRPGGSILFTGGTGCRDHGVGLSLDCALTAARPALIANLALEIAPVRVNLIGGGFVDRPLSARLLGATLDRHLSDPVAARTITRVVRPTDVAALAVHLMCTPSITGATYDVDAGRRVA